LNHVIEENHRLCELNEKYRILVTPTLRQFNPEENEPPKPANPMQSGSTWQRVMAREVAADEERWRLKQAAELAAAAIPKVESKEKTNAS
jgi:hypothetical protein